MQELKLRSGACVRVRPVPPHVVIQFNKNVTKALPPEPKPPTKTVKMADGHVEQDTIAEGSPEWDTYQAARDRWEQACEAVIADKNDEYNVLQRDYAIIEWSFDGVLWLTDVPEDWQFPEACVRAGIEPCGNRRVDYIGIELLTTTDDWLAVRQVADGATAPITDEEAGAVRAGFRPGDRRTGHAIAKKQGWFGRLAQSLSRRNAGGEGVESHS